MKALVLAAGYATRLYPLTKEYPKPLLEVAGRPIIDYIIEKLNAIKELDEIIIVTNSKFIAHFRRWAKGIESAKPIKLVDNQISDLHKKRGAIGDMNFAIRKERINDNLLVIGADNLFDAGLKDFIAFARKIKDNPVIGVYDLKVKKMARHYGVLKLNRQGKVAAFQEKPRIPRSTLVGMCLYYFPKDKLRLIEEYLDQKTDKHDATGYYIDWLSKKYAVYAFVFGGRWYDIGDAKFYQEAQENFEHGYARIKERINTDRNP